MNQDYPALTLSTKSILNYILHSNVLDFIKLSIDKNLQGIYNLASSSNITLEAVANLFKKKVKFGDYLYNVGNIDNKKIALIFPAFKKTSKRVVLEFLKEHVLQ